MSNKSMTDIAFEFLQNNNEVPFATLWSEVCTKLGFSKEMADRKIDKFYSAMMLDSRFLPLANNLWDLKKKYRFDESHFDTSKIAIDDDDDLDDEFDFDFDDEEEESEKDEDLD
ncbi:MAG: DNA-directed RNA polymerase subunit delta [Erysipelothrix sp.]|jgi:DNA-directed RNA polymerase delta subunit|nr:DNA-directed RNA polymerase subunit delta [Erysipelothrix sp.]